MPSTSQVEPVQDTISKINDELAVGEDLEFQRKWWRFERAVWIAFLAIVILDVLGVFGRGYFAKARVQASDASMDIRYERVERFSTPSVLTIQFGQNTIHDGRVELWASESLVKPLGNQRVLPQPLTSTIERGGILYTFSATETPASVEFALEPSSPGLYSLTLQVAGFARQTIQIFVMP